MTSFPSDTTLLFSIYLAPLFLYQVPSYLLLMSTFLAVFYLFYPCPRPQCPSRKQNSAESLLLCSGPYNLYVLLPDVIFQGPVTYFSVLNVLPLPFLTLTLLILSFQFFPNKIWPPSDVILHCPCDLLGCSHYSSLINSPFFHFEYLFFFPPLFVVSFFFTLLLAHIVLSVSKSAPNPSYWESSL